MPRNYGSAECWCCGREGTCARGLCVRCYSRWHGRGFQGPGPGPERVPYAEKAAGLIGGIPQHDSHEAEPPSGALTARQMAERIGVSERTVTRYRAALREAS
jgi:hypothetical protein